jgi:hypothetical protein
MQGFSCCVKHVIERSVLVLLMFELDGCNDMFNIDEMSLSQIIVVILERSTHNELIHGSSRWWGWVIIFNQILVKRQQTPQ